MARIPPFDDERSARATSAESPTVTSADPAVVKPLLHPGETFGNYRIVRLLGRGGVGEVYEADDLESGRRLALKVLHSSLSTPTDRSRFLREGQLAASISHPNTVYVFGSDEVAGVPVIAMELVSGGTLNDRVKALGQLTVAEAVRAILDVVAGLSALAQVGVLHRDVKPSNCFIAGDGTIKIGDFGISIPVTAGEQSRITASRTILGTPAFCSPEQLRGESLDERSDIYAVGATLFCLLVGRPPFREDNLVRLVEKTLSTVPDRVRKYRGDVPPELCRLIASCLAKDPKARPQTYEALATALEPFVDIAEAAPLPLRALAGLLDVLIIWVIGVAAAIILQLRPEWVLSPSQLHFMLMDAGIGILYFGLPEGVYGSSLGKYVMGLGVVRDDDSSVGILRGIVRASILFAALQLPILISVAGYDDDRMTIATWVGNVAFLFLFFTARPANGLRGIHELASGTRTVVRPTRERLERRLPADATVPSVDVSAPRIGPYRVLLRFDNDPSVVLAYDERLRRRVWLRLHAHEVPVISNARRDLGRQVRCRWLGGKRTTEGCWDAYEYVAGAPFQQVSSSCKSFRAVAQWLVALVTECRSSKLDGTLATIGVDSLWITKTGELKVFDWPIPFSSVHPAKRYSPSSIQECQALLSDVVDLALQGLTVNRQADGVPIPAFGRKLIASLQQATFDDFESLFIACEIAAAHDSDLSKRRRAAPIAIVGTVALIPIVGDAASVLSKRWRDQRILIPEQLSNCLNEFRQFERAETKVPEREKRAVGLCVAVLSRSLDTRTRSMWLQVPEFVELRDRAMAEHPSASVDDLEASWQDLPRYTALVRHVKGFVHFSPIAVGSIVSRSTLIGILPLCGLGVCCILIAILVREGPLYRALGIAVVTADGAGSSRLRAGVRAGASWLPAILAAAVLRYVGPQNQAWQIALVWCAFVAMAGGAAYAILRPNRGIAERISGTYLVRR
jgi:uncharacterized RDD family membrane protein YckC